VLSDQRWSFEERVEKEELKREREREKRRPKAGFVGM
jgi:hypothetical protein